LSDKVISTNVMDTQQTFMEAPEFKAGTWTYGDVNHPAYQYTEQLWAQYYAKKKAMTREERAAHAEELEKERENCSWWSTKVWASQCKICGHGAHVLWDHQTTCLQCYVKKYGESPVFMPSPSIRSCLCCRNGFDE
jgi:hypothetical protein